jgi:hypothetical protein
MNLSGDVGSRRVAFVRGDRRSGREDIAEWLKSCCGMGALALSLAFGSATPDRRTFTSSRFVPCAAHTLESSRAAKRLRLELNGRCRP